MIHAARISAGSVSVVSPTGEIPPELFAEYAAIVLLEPEPELLANWVSALEGKLGVTDMDRTFVAGGEQAVRQVIRRQRSVKAQAERKRAVALSEPNRSPALASEIERDLRLLAKAEADAKLARAEADAHRAAKRHQQHRAAVGRERDAFTRIRQLRKAITDARARQLTTRWTAQAVSETEALGKARGEEFEDAKTEVSDWLRDPESGARIIENGLPVLKTEKATTKRVNSRDPIRSLLKAGHLTASQHDAGQEVHELYGARGEGLGSQMRNAGQVGSPGADNSRQIWSSVQRAKKLQRLGTIERAVALQCRAEPMALAMLRSVCGEGNSLSSQGEGRAFTRNLTALQMALDVAAAVMRPAKTA